MVERVADKRQRYPRLVMALRWTARVIAALALLLWGAFFVEHLEWFRDPRELPPASVLGLQLLHLLMLVGLVAGWRYELAGGVLLLISSLWFFACVAGSQFLLFSASTAVPALLWIVSGWLKRGRRKHSDEKHN